MFGRNRKLDDFTSEIEAHIQLEIERLISNISFRELAERDLKSDVLEAKPNPTSPQ